MSVQEGDQEAKGDACCAKYPTEPEFLFRRALVLLQLGRTDEARDVLSQAEAVDLGWSALPLRFADADMISVRRDELETLVSGLTPKDTTSSNAPEKL